MFWRIIEDKQQDNHESQHRKSKEDISEYKPTQRPWYKKGTINEKFTWTEDYVFESIESLGITATIPLISNGEVIAVIGADITLSDLDTFLAGVEIAPGSKAFIINKKSRYWHIPIKKYFSMEMHFMCLNWIEQNPKKSSRLTANTLIKNLIGPSEEGDVFHTTQSIIELNEKRHIVIVLDYPETINSEWTLIVYAPLKYFWGPKDEIREVVLYISLLILLIAIMISRYIARYISTPIRTLADQAFDCPESAGQSKLQVRYRHNGTHRSLQCIAANAGR